MIDVERNLFTVALKFAEEAVSQVKQQVSEVSSGKGHSAMKGQKKDALDMTSVSQWNQDKDESEVDLLGFGDLVLPFLFRCAYETLQLQAEEVTCERDQLKSDLSALQEQVAYLMAEREKAKAALEAPTAEEEAVEHSMEGELRTELSFLQRQLANLTQDRSLYYQGSRRDVAEGDAPNHLQRHNLQRGPQKSFKVDFAGDPNKLIFFLIQVGSSMEIHGNSFNSDRERVFEIGIDSGGRLLTGWWA
uniref:Uncharacterized protein n=1 Tax=Sphaerodactylus townsendi TaxID=933632 RepID=A0ACB8FJY1_9SAUR